VWGLLQKGSVVGVAGDARLDKQGGRGSASGKGKPVESVWRGFINVNLDPSQKDQFADWVRTGEPWSVLEAVVGSGAHVAVKLDQGSAGFMASITQRNPTHINAGLCVTARSGDAYKALFRALYLVNVLGVDSDWSGGQAPADPDRW